MKIKLKRSDVSGKIPLIADLDFGEVALNTADGKLYMKRLKDGTEIIAELTATISTGSGSGAVIPSAYASLLKFS